MGFEFSQGQRGRFGPESNEECICPICGFKIFHEDGVPCYNKNCPKCGMMMTKMR
jgi:hypothetical protein